jgi:hypothetical protein
VLVSDLLDDIEAQSVRAAKPAYPDGVGPSGIEWNGTSGSIASTGTAKSPDWSGLIRYWDYSPDEIEVVEGTVQVRTWDAAIGNGEVRRMWYHRASLRRKRTGADIGELLGHVKRQRPASVTGGANAHLLALNDWQLGKRGTAQAVDRIVKAIDASAELVRRRKPASVWLAFLGDLGEACDGQYAMQTFEVELDRRDQGRLTRRLALYAIDEHRKVAPSVVVPAVGGNHGEHRKDGKAFTTFSDNDDVAWIEEVAETCAHNPAAYGNVRFLLPRADLTLTVQPVPDGPIVGLVHGHQFPRGSVAPKVAEDWWKGQMYGQRPAGDATILVSAHRHHFAVVKNGPRSWIQAPTMDSGSPWFAERSGVDSAPGCSRSWSPATAGTTSSCSSNPGRHHAHSGSRHAGLAPQGVDRGAN